jgi:hypothetical protein
MEVADGVLGQVTIDILSDSQRQNEQVSSTLLETASAKLTVTLQLDRTVSLFSPVLSSVRVPTFPPVQHLYTIHEFRVNYHASSSTDIFFAICT